MSMQSQAAAPRQALNEQPGASSPAVLHATLAAAFNRHDVDALAALFEADALLLPEGGNSARGQAAIRKALVEWLAVAEHVTLRVERVLEAAGVALVVSAWSMACRDSAGRCFCAYGQTADVARQQPDGRWLLAIANPYGLE